MLQEVGELGMLTLDDSITLQCSLYKERCTAASPQEQSTEYVVSQNHSSCLSSLHHHTLPLLCYKSQLLHLFFFLFSCFTEQFTLPCSQPATLASKEGEWGEVWSLCTSVILTPLLRPLPPSREYWVSSPCSPQCRQSCNKHAELE